MELALLDVTEKWFESLENDIFFILIFWLIFFIIIRYNILIDRNIVIFSIWIYSMGILSAYMIVIFGIWLQMNLSFSRNIENHKICYHFLANCNNFNRTLYTFDLYSGGTIFIDFKILINNIPLFRYHYFLLYFLIYYS